MLEETRAVWHEALARHYSNIACRQPDSIEQLHYFHASLDRYHRAIALLEKAEQQARRRNQPTKDLQTKINDLRRECSTLVVFD